MGTIFNYFLISMPREMNVLVTMKVITKTSKGGEN